jgi:phenylpyruvate tautomerase PptA (4-oxalocrotonate tautomerase family)
MPRITVKGPPVSVDVKRSLVRGITEAAGEAYGIPKEKFMVHVAEYLKENTGTTVWDRGLPSRSF